MSEQVFVQIRFTVQTEYGEYSDALYYSLNDYDLTSQEDIENAKQARVDAWVSYILNPPQEVIQPDN